MTEKQLVKKLKINNNNRKLFSLFFKQIKTVGWGNFNEKECSVCDKKIKTIVQSWDIINYINELYTPNRLRFDDVSFFIKKLFLTKAIDLIIILCPSYKKDGNTGISNEIGNTTKIALNNMLTFFNMLRINFEDITTNLNCYYSDLSLEKYCDQIDDEWTSQIDQNILNIQNILKEHKSKMYVNVKKLSSIPDLNSGIGRKGILNPSVVVNNQSLTTRIQARNSLFYMNILGWDQEKSIERSNRCISAYALMGKYFVNQFQNPLLLYTANIYEKGVAYNFDTKTNPLFIVYLKKINGLIMQIHDQ